MGSNRQRLHLNWTDVLLLCIGATYWPLNVLASNLTLIVHPERVLALAVLIWIANLLGATVLMLFGVRRTSAVSVCFLVTVVWISGGGLVGTTGLILGYAMILVVVSWAVWLSLRVGGEVIMDALVWGLAVALIAMPGLSFYQRVDQLAEVSTVVRTPEMDLSLTDRPDIFLVVVDGYPGLLATSQDRVPDGAIDIRAELEDVGFEFPSSAWSSYWTTSAAIPSILDMGYPIRVGAEGPSTTRDLYQILSGHSRLHEVLARNDYKSHYIESGWGGSSCGGFVDVCVPSPIMDEAMFLTLRHSVAAPVTYEFRGPFINGSLATMDWLRNRAPSLSANDSADFVFAHVLAPHPPLFFGDDCSVNLSRSRAGTSFNSPGVPTDVREGYLVEQMDCVESFMVDLASLIDQGDVLIFVSDHGTDRRYQAVASQTEWGREAIVERSNVLVAARLPGECSLGDELVTSNLMRRTLSCLSDEPVRQVRPRMWVDPLVELDENTVGELMRMRDDSR